MNVSQAKVKAVQVFQSIDWEEVAHWAGLALRAMWLTLRVIAMAIVLVAELTYENRENIRDFLATVVAVAILTSQLTYEAGVATRDFLESFNDRSAALTPQQPVKALASITAPIQAFWEVLEEYLAPTLSPGFSLNHTQKTYV